MTTPFAATNEPTGVEQYDNPFEDDPQPTGGPLQDVLLRQDYLAAADRLEGNAAKLVTWAKRRHADSNGPASLRQYRLLAGTLDKLLGGEGRHNDLLGVLVGRVVTQANPPGESLAGALLDRLTPQNSAMEHGRKVKVPNPKYRPDVARVVVEIWKAVTA